MCVTPSRSNASTTSLAPLAGSARGSQLRWAALLMSRGLGLGLRLGRFSGGSFTLEPGHVLAQLGADLLDRLRQILVPHALVFGFASLALGNPLAGERSTLDVAKD